MPRIKFADGAQCRFLCDIKEYLGFDWREMAAQLSVHPRSLSDWRRERYTLPKPVFSQLCEMSNGNVLIPPHGELKDFWSIQEAARKGGIALAKKYGGPGTPEGRRKGGKTSQERRKLHPELYQQCNLRKEITKPMHSDELAELFGIILGDGGVHSKYQVVITLHKIHDWEYAQYVRVLTKQLFSIEPAQYTRNGIRRTMVVDVVLGGASIVEFLLSEGLSRGNKVTQQVDVPNWISSDIRFAQHCLRGLIDTDGGVYYHKHQNQSHSFLNIGMQFSNRSQPLLRFVYNTLRALGFTPSIDGRQVNLYKEEEVLRYAREIKFHNPYHNQKVEKFPVLKNKIRRGARAV